MANENLDIDSKTAEELYEWYLDDKLIINRRYQRKLVWSLEEKTALISSMTQQYPIPLLLFVSIDNKREILDGMQRLEALMSFIEQRFSLNGKYFNLDAIALTKQLKDSGKLQQKEPVLSRESSTLIARYRFAISEYSSTEDHIDEVFRRINSNGKILSKQELRSAGCVSNFSELVRKISTIIRGDTTHSDIMGLNKIHNISICNDGLDYGINIDNHFYIRNHIISRPSIRDSDDEELVANILGYIFLDDKPTSGSTSLDTFYGEGSTSHAIHTRTQLENYIQTNGADKIVVVHNNGDFYSAENLALSRGSRSFQKVVDQSSPRCFIKPYGHRNQQINITVWLQAAIHCGAVQMYGQQRRFEMALDDANYL